MTKPVRCANTMPASNQTERTRFEVAEVIYAGDAGIFKTCSICDEAKSVSDFHRNKNASDGRVSSCKPCAKAAVIAGPASTFLCTRCEQQKPRTAMSLQKYCSDCLIDVRRERDRARRPRTIVGFEAKCDRCDETFVRKHGTQVVCPYCIKIVNRERGYDWNQRHPERRLAASKAYNDKKRATPRGHLEWAMRVAVRRAVIDGSIGGRRTFDLLGYTVDDLKAHLERLFVDGMSWDNYGEWHIDHKTPLSVHNYETPDDIDFKRAWALSNLQPLWKKDNLSKGARLNAPFQPSLAI